MTLSNKGPYPINNRVSSYSWALTFLILIQNEILKNVRKGNLTYVF